MRNSLILVLASFAITACQSPSQSPQDSITQDDLLNAVVIVPPEKDPLSQNAEDQLAEAAEEVSRSITKLAQIERANRPEPPQDIKLPVITAEMAGKASVDYNGPVEPMLKQLATVSHLKFRSIGRPLAIPPMISIYVRRTPIADILKDISYQVQKQAQVQLIEDEKVLEIRYNHA
tara:strand:+ start:841 stop:1368 length:528 start_codon:yes stop_codon:yes gene_type:complete